MTYTLDEPMITFTTEGNSVARKALRAERNTREANRFLVQKRLKNQRAERERRLSNVIRKVSRLAAAF